MSAVGSPVELLNLVRKTLEALNDSPSVFLDRAKVPNPEPQRYVLIDYISGTPARATFDERPKRFLVQVACYSKVSRADAFALQTQITPALKAAGLQEGTDRDMPLDEGYWGAMTDWSSL